jgi:hypothetical protein
MGKILEVQIEDLFLKKAVKAIRRKEDIIILLLESIKLFLLGNVLEIPEVKGKVLLKIDKMSRLIFEIRNKYFSFNFPFNVEVDDISSDIRIYDSLVGIDFDSKLVSILISIFNQKIITNRCLDDIYYELACGDNIPNINDIWIIVERLSMFECGYLRYDYDEEYQNGHLHPINHLDINYSVGSTFKIGFEDIITLEHFLDILDLKTNCHYLKKI